MKKEKKAMPSVGMLSTCKGNQSDITSLLKWIFVIVFIFVTIITYFAQNNNIMELKRYSELPIRKKTSTKVGIGIEKQLSGNSHGSLHCTYINLSSPKNIFSTGICLQERTKSFCGIKFNYSRNLTNTNFSFKDKSLTPNNTDDEKLLSLSTFAFAQYIYNTSLGYTAAKKESIARISDRIDYNNVKLSTIEGGVGFEIKVRLYNNMYLKNYVGASFYYHTQYIQGLYLERMCNTLIFGTAIDISCFDK